MGNVVIYASLQMLAATTVVVTVLGWIILDQRGSVWMVLAAVAVPFVGGWLFAQGIANFARGYFQWRRRRE